MEFEKIKLVIWDLDDTFWSGTLSEEEIAPDERNIALVNNLTDMGIVNSISSKNDFEQVRTKLEELGVWDCFVFLSVNWSAKGQRVKDQIKDMGLRAPNVLFIDDNHLNLEEVKFYNPEIMAAGVDILPELRAFAASAEKKDPRRARLAQYKMLEIKIGEKSRASSNEEFLESSNITVKIAGDCLEQLDRIHELVTRTNQLNYTKKRSSLQELRALVGDRGCSCGYVSASDRFGDYGIVGFFALKDKALLHFLFSCRTLGMGVEQYVYAALGYPELSVEGEVISELQKTGAPAWINKAPAESAPPKRFDASGARILFKGPCDLEQIFAYIEQSDNIDCEFTYVSERTGVLIEQHNHTAHIVGSLTLRPEQKQTLIDELPFSDKDMFSDRMFKNGYGIVFLSLLTDGNLGVYRRRETGELTAFGEAYYPLTDKKNWEAYLNGEIFRANLKFSAGMLEDFASKYECLGRLSAAQIVENVVFIRDHLPKDTLLVLFLGVEIPYGGAMKPSYQNRHLFHRELNAQIRKLAAEYDTIKLIEFGKYVDGQNKFFNGINHFTKPVYYAVAKEAVGMINLHAGCSLPKPAKTRMLKDYAVQIIKKIIGRI